ncbi:hypothetical protein Ppa06_61290 [Planomonospora parontospora subsp. parontospora]|uniref:Uncharacterized protein n=2 Tax=Planomonospora parontospora TaxID=58119 RepID=A0AA37F3U4_9ACTN|nr:hypothetical protein GCM10010126_22090 [Planomonospora parontospora]GII12331.1 hypothetical protein Ppa06_61290 [Planomonospora parontospora subsp. parontospora]
MALTVLVLAAQSVPFLYETRRLAEGPWTVAHYLPVLASALPLLARRRYPFAVLVLTLAASGLYSLNDPDNPAQPSGTAGRSPPTPWPNAVPAGGASPGPRSSSAAPCSRWAPCPRSCGGW